MIADDTPRNLEKLMSGGGQIVAEIAAPIGLLTDCWENTPEIEHFDLAPTDGEYIRCSLSARAGHDLRPQIFSLVCQRGWKLRELTHSRHSLEDIFVSVTRPDREEET
jgi:ABC-2 type transport system ATP-binding protein